MKKNTLMMVNVCHNCYLDGGYMSSYKLQTKKIHHTTLTSDFS